MAKTQRQWKDRWIEVGQSRYGEMITLLDEPPNDSMYAYQNE